MSQTITPDGRPFRLRNVYSQEDIQRAKTAQANQDARDARSAIDRHPRNPQEIQDDLNAQNAQDAQDAQDVSTAFQTQPDLYYVKKVANWACPVPELDINDVRDTTENGFWFKTPPLTANDIGQLTAIQLATHSMDQRLENDRAAGSGAWFEVAIRGRDDNHIKRLRNGQTLAWFSHNNAFGSQKLESCVGRIFTKGDEIFKHLMVGDVISVWMSAAPRHRNYADIGCLFLQFSREPKLHYRKFPEDRIRVPIISVCAEERQECLMSQGNDFPPEMKANNVQSGVGLMVRLLESQGNDWEVKPHALKLANRAFEVSPNFDSVIELGKNKKKDVIPSMQIVKQSAVRGPGQDKGNNVALPDPQGTPKIIVWDDSGVNKKEVEVQDPNAEILVYQMHAPLWSGTLWEKATANAEQQMREAAKGNGLDRATIVVIDADDLRADGIRISRGISWEKTMEDFHAQIGRINDKIREAQKDVNRDRVLDIMQRGVHLLVRCGYEGVLHLRPSLDGKPRPFVFHMVPNMAEGDLLRPYHGQMSGIDLAFVTGLTASLARQPGTHPLRMGRTQIGQAIELAIIWSRRFANTGFCQDAEGRLNYPKAKDVNNDLTPEIKVIYGDQSKIGVRGRWSLFNALEQRQESVAAEVVKLGTERLEASVPTATFGAVQTADRTEIEGYRSTAAVVHEYLKGNAKKPLSIAVFGQPGAGKSFGVKQVIKAVLRDCGQDECKPIEANLSQFQEYSDLVAVFHKVRDVALKGQTPVVLFDEFDSSYDGDDLGWLKYFLAPMQDGEFLDSGSVRPLGRAIFIFIGGTSSTFREFRDGKELMNAEDEAAEAAAAEQRAVEQEDVEAAAADTAEAKKRVRDEAAKIPTNKDKKAKKPDFVSRLSAHINVKGPNQSDAGDKMFVMRRAMMLHAQLKTHFGVDVKDIQVDDTVLNALLNHERFPNGIRSIELILQTSRLSGRRRFEASDLASDEQLSMHVGDVAAFHRLVDNPITLEPIRPVDIELYNKLLWTRLPKDTN